MARIGVFGGTFDPPHVGHLVAMHDVRDALDLDRLLLVPAAVPPHRPGWRGSDAAVRLRMVEAAVRGDPAVHVSRLEDERGGLSYTVDTLRALRAQAPGDHLHLVLGADQVAAFGTWRDPEAIARLARLVAMTRAGAEPQPRGPSGYTWEVVQVTRIDVSSTDVRQRVRAGRSIRHLVPDPVRRIIEEEGLYASETRAVPTEADARTRETAGPRSSTAL